MSYKIEQTSTLGRQLHGDFPWDTVAPRIQKEAEVIQRKAKIAGFRPGKAPLNLIQREYGANIYAEVVNNLMGDTLSEAMTKDNLSLASYPTYKPQQMVQGESVKFVIEFEVLPEVNPKDLTGKQITRVTAEVTDKVIDDTIEKLRGQMRTYAAVDRAAAKDDKVEAKLTVAVEGAENEVYDDFFVVLGEGKMIPGFEDALIGVKTGETREFDTNFPENYQHKPYAGKTGRFTAEVKQVLGSVLPEIDDAFAVQYGIAEGTVAALRTELRHELERELGWKLKQKLKDQVFDAVYELNTIEVPASQVKEESMRLMRNAFEQFTKQMSKADKDKLFANMDSSLMAGEAKKRVTLSYVINALVKQHDLKADPERVRQLVEQRASLYNEKEHIINEIMNNPKLLQEYEGLAIEDQLVDLLLQTAKVIDEPSSFDEIMTPAQPEYQAAPAEHEHVHDEHCAHGHQDEHA